VKAGDPFDTKARDDRRAKQRHFLRTVPDFLLYQALEHENLREVVGAEAKGLAEDALRHRAQTMIDGLPDDLRQQMVAKAEAEALSAQFTARSIDLVFGLDPEDFMLPIVREVEIEARRDVLLDDDVYQPLAQAAVLLVWADLVASDDGGMDPRVQRIQEVRRRRS